MNGCAERFDNETAYCGSPLEDAPALMPFDLPPPLLTVGQFLRFDGSVVRIRRFSPKGRNVHFEYVNLNRQRFLLQRDFSKLAAPL